jgi:hypothetical protein
MSICTSGLEAKLKPTSVTTLVPTTDPLIKLANALNWQEMANIIEPDLRKTAKGFWHLGRKLRLRIHLSIYILQCLLKQTDRGIEENVRQTPVLQVFCGLGIVAKWRCPDHTKVEEFRNRLQPETHKQVGHLVIKSAQALGFADLSWMDLDSTVQEANMAYPSDAHLMKKLGEKCHKVLEFLKSKAKSYLPKKMEIDIKALRKKAMEYFFLAKTTAIEKKRAVFSEFHQLTKSTTKPLIKFCERLTEGQIKNLPWNIKRDVQVLRNKAWRYLLDVAHFARTSTLKTGKILSFHLDQVACIKKGKVGKPHEFGRAFQLGRVGGNFLIAFGSLDVRMNDKQSFIPVIEEHQSVFGADVLKEIGTDKGYYTAENIRDAKQRSINADGLQRPANIKKQPPQEVVQLLRDRRAGVEPLIGHAKQFGLGKSKMKSDGATLSSGYRSVMGFNLHQLTGHMRST